MHSVKYGAINATDPQTMVYCVVKYLSKSFKLQDDIITNEQLSKAVDLVVSSEYLGSMK